MVTLPRAPEEQVGADLIDRKTTAAGFPPRPPSSMSPRSERLGAAPLCA